MYESRVGSKNELFPPKEIREKLGLKPGMKVIFRIENGKLIVEPVPSVRDLLGEKPPVEISLKEFHEARKKLSRRFEE